MCLVPFHSLEQFTVKSKCKKSGCFAEACCRDGHCADHTSAERPKRNHSATIAPRTREPHIGVEIECIARNDKSHKAMLAQRSLPCSDGSLGDHGCEYKLCAPGDKVIRKAALLVSHIRHAGAFVDSRCGLHVHLDCRYADRTRIMSVCDWLRGQQNWLFSLMPKSRRNNNFCCRSINEGHYSWCNLTSKRTVEIRLHGGTLNPHKMAGWLSAMKCILEKLNKPTLALPGFVGASVKPFTEVEPTRLAVPPMNAVTGRRDAQATILYRASEALHCEWQSRKQNAERSQTWTCDPAWLRAAYPCPVAQEYLLARQSAGGHLDRMEQFTNQDQKWEEDNQSA
jgi:hypothetical protein